MSKKYLSLEEAAVQIGISTSELNRLREKGSIRAFADRGTWKFKEEEVEKLARSRQAGSDPEVPLRAFDVPAEGSSADLLFSDDDVSASEPTIIRKGRGDDTGSDSDVRLIFDDSMNVPDAEDSSGDTDDSDSDVKLAGGTAGSAEAGSDSDVKLVTDTEPAESTGSDSDVQLVSSDSSGDVKVAGPGSSVLSGEMGSGKYGSDKGENSAIDLVPEGRGSSIDEEDDGISLAEGSGITLASDSGISLERPNDSGISLSEESMNVLSHDSGISLADEDSGISLAPEPPKVKSAGKDKGKKGKSLADSDDLTGTIPLMDIPLVEEDDVLNTQMEVPSMSDSSDEASVVGDSGSGTSVITLDDDEEASEYSVTSVKKKPADATDEQDVYTGEEDVVEDAEEAEAVDVADEIIGEDDELGGDVFGAEDEDFGDVESGVSSADLPIGGPRLAAPIEQEWGTPTFAGLVLSAVLLIACGTVMFDLVRNMWHTDTARQNPVSSMLLETFKGL